MKNLRITTIITSACIFALCFIGQARTDVLHVPSNDYSTISAALEDAFAKDEIIVAAGTYEENITVATGAKLIGAGRDKTTITASKRDAITIEAPGVPPTIEGFTIDGHEELDDGISCYSEAIIKDIAIIGMKDAGILISESSVTIDNVIIENVAGNGIDISAFGSIDICSVNISNAIIRNVEGNGINIDWDTSLSVRKTVITRCDGNGIDVYEHSEFVDLGTEAEPGNNKIYRNRGYNLRNQSVEVINAIGNWWGSDPPMEELFDGNIVYEPWLTQPPPPHISIENVSPNSGTMEGGLFVTITGKNFVDGATVKFGENIASDITVVSETKITAKTPAAEVAGTVDVTVINSDQTRSILRDAFRYEDKITGTFTVSFDKGLNMVSLPNHPDASYTAKSLAEKIGDVTWIVRYNKSAKQFEAYLPKRAQNEGFAIEGGEGYIINVTASKDVDFRGTVWDNANAAPRRSRRFAKPQRSEMSTWAFVIAGRLPSELCNTENLTITIYNENRNIHRKLSLSNSEFCEVFVDAERHAVVEAGDKFLLEVTNANGRLVAERQVTVEPTELIKAYKIVNPRYNPIPNQTALLQNYPNPFNPETWIPYQLHSDGEVKITIYDAVGRLVHVLDLGEKNAGIYETKNRAVYWDGRNTLEEIVSSGLYFYELRVDNNYVDGRKMVIIR